MGRYYQNRRRCHISKKRVKIVIFKGLLGLLFAFSLSSVYLSLLDQKMRKNLKPYVDMEVERITTNIINQAIQEKMKEKSTKNFLIFDEKTGKISYDTIKLNQLKNEVSQYVQKVLEEMDSGTTESFLAFQKKGRFKHIRKGILAENTLNSLRGSTLFGNIGPSIPTRLFFMGQIHSDIDIKAKEYGMNNVMVTVYLTIKIKEQISMPLSSSEKEITIKKLLAADIFQGKIPQYYTGIVK